MDRVVAFALTLALGSSTAAGQIEPPVDDPALAAFLEAVRLEQGMTDDPIPGDARPSPAGHHVSADGRALYLRVRSALWRVALRGPALPPGTRLVPIVGLSTVRFASLPDQEFALLFPDQDRVFIFDSHRVTWSLPIERVGSGGLAQTHLVRAMRACPESRAPCALIGRYREVEAAEDPVAPNHGWSLVERPDPALPDGLRYARVRQSVGVPGVELRIDRGALPGGGTVDRVHLAIGDALHHAFERAYAGSSRPLEPRYAVVALGRRLYVHDHGGTVSVHDRRTGARTELRRVAVEPYHDVCGADDDGFALLPVLEGRRVGFALLWLNGRAYVFDALGGASVARRVSVEAERFFDVSWLARRGRELSPRFIERN